MENTFEVDRTDDAAHVYTIGVYTREGYYAAQSFRRQIARSNMRDGVCDKVNVTLCGRSV